MNELLGVAAALIGSVLGGAASSAWKGDLLMIAAALQAICNMLSRSFIRRMGAFSFTAFGLSVGAVALVAVSAGSGVFQALPPLGRTAWATVVYLGTF
jgi:hypothetical protein